MQGILSVNHFDTDSEQDMLSLAGRHLVSPETPGVMFKTKRNKAIVADLL